MPLISFKYVCWRSMIFVGQPHYVMVPEFNDPVSRTEKRDEEKNILNDPSYQCGTAGWGTAGQEGPGAAAWGFPGSLHQNIASEDGPGESWRGRDGEIDDDTESDPQLSAFQSDERVSTVHVTI